MTAHRERIFSGPNRLDDLEAGILPVGVNSNQTAAGAQRPCERRNDAFGAEIDRGFGPVGLRSDNQVEIGLRAAGARDDLVKQKSVVFPVQHDGDRPLIDRHARPRADIGAPVLFQKRPQFGNLGLEFARGGPAERHLVPDHARGGGRGWMLPSSSATRSAVTRFSPQVWTNSRYFWRFSKNRKLPRGSRFSGGTSSPRGGGTPPGIEAEI